MSHVATHTYVPKVFGWKNDTSGLTRRLIIHGIKMALTQNVWIVKELDY